VFDLLQHPPHSPERAPIGASVSLATHVLLALVLIAGTQKAVEHREEIQQSIVETALRFLLPPDKKAAPQTEDHAQWAAERTGQQNPSTFTVKNGTPVPMNTGANARQDVDGSAPVSLAEAAKAQDAFTLLDVDTAAVRDPESAAPLYPPVLQSQGIEGVAVVRFVVDTTGRADPESFTLVETNHPLFAAAVQDALPRMKFTPAKTGTKVVRQLVELPFAFRIVHRESVAPPPAAPAPGKKP
jgi:protein TonB